MQLPIIVDIINANQSVILADLAHGVSVAGFNVELPGGLQQRTLIKRPPRVAGRAVLESTDKPRIKRLKAVDNARMMAEE